MSLNKQQSRIQAEIVREGVMAWKDEQVKDNIAEVLDEIEDAGYNIDEDKFFNAELVFSRQLTRMQYKINELRQRYGLEKGGESLIP